MARIGPCRCEAHQDHSPVQHGLASMIANPDGGASIFWLEALKGEDAPVSLKRTIVDASGKEVREEVIQATFAAAAPRRLREDFEGTAAGFSRPHARKTFATSQSRAWRTAIGPRPKS